MEKQSDIAYGMSYTHLNEKHGINCQEEQECHPLALANPNQVVCSPTCVTLPCRNSSLTYNLLIHHNSIAWQVICLLTL